MSPEIDQKKVDAFLYAYNYMHSPSSLPRPRPQTVLAPCAAAKQADASEGTSGDAAVAKGVAEARKRRG